MIRSIITFTYKEAIVNEQSFSENGVSINNDAFLSEREIDKEEVINILKLHSGQNTEVINEGIKSSIEESMPLFLDLSAFNKTLENGANLIIITPVKHSIH